MPGWYVGLLLGIGTRRANTPRVDYVSRLSSTQTTILMEFG